MPLRASTSIEKGIELFDAHSKLSAGTNATRVMPQSTPTKQLSLGSLSFLDRVLGYNLLRWRGRSRGYRNGLEGWLGSNE